MKSDKTNQNYFYFAVIGVDVNSTADTLTEIMNWFQSGNNVAVSKF